MIDLHAHLLPGIDDGPETLDEAVAMARVAVADGVREMACTPHVGHAHPGVVPQEIPVRVAELQATLDEAGLPLRLRRGGEVAFDAAADLSGEALEAVSLGGAGWILLETPHSPMPTIFEEVVTRLRERAAGVLLAHPELSPTLQARPERLGALVAAGARTQLSAPVFLRPRGSRSRELALVALRRGWAHVLASDAHAVAWRPPGLTGGILAALEAEPGADARLRWMVEAAPAAILAGGDPGPGPEVVAPLRRPRRWGRRT